MNKLKLFISLLFVGLLLTACNSEGKYEVKNGTVYYTYWTFSFGTQEHELPEVDAASFESIEDWLGRDNSHVWFKDQLVKGADPATAKVKEYPLFYDNHDYYYQGKALNVADMNSFHILKCGDDELWATDSRYVYFKDQRIEDSDPESLELVAFYIAKDKHHVYYAGRILQDADPTTYEVFPTSNYAKDSCHVWYCGKLIADADPATFEVMEDFSFCKDGNHVWHGDVIIEDADPATFQVLEDFYWKDRNHVWHNKKILEGADAATFETISRKDTDQPNARDKYRNYINGWYESDWKRMNQ